MTNNFNTELFKRINSYTSKYPALDIIAIFIAKAGVLVIPTYLIWIFLKDKGRYRQQALSGLYCGTLGLLLNYLTSLLYFVPRPSTVHAGITLIHHSNDASFPSDHVTLILSVGFYFMYNTELRYQGVFITLLGVAVGLARVFCGIHWPMDVMGSIATSLIACVTIISIEPLLNRLNNCIIHLIDKTLKKLLD